MFRSESIYTQPAVEGAIERVNIFLLVGCRFWLCHERGAGDSEIRRRVVCMVYVYHTDNYRRGERGEEWKEKEKNEWSGQESDHYKTR